MSLTELKTHVSLDEIRKVVRQIVELFHPQRVILFGSQVTGKATGESDLDLLVVMDMKDASRLEMARRIREAVTAPKRNWMGHELTVWLDIHPFSPKEFEASLRRKGVFLTTAVTEGIVLYEAPDAMPLRILLEQPSDWEGEGMKPETQEWIAKAEDDLAGAQALYERGLYDLVCFHAQQCAEKYLKAFLEEQGISIPKTHKLTELMDLSGGLLTELDPLRPALAKLSDYAVISHYVGFKASQKDVEEALQTAQEVRSVVRAMLGLS